MAYNKLTMINNETAETRIAPVGISWETLFFSFIPALMRNNQLSAILIFCSCLALNLLLWNMGLGEKIQYANSMNMPTQAMMWNTILFASPAICNLFFIFSINKSYIKSLHKKGFVAQSVSSGTIEEVEEKLRFKLR